MPTVRKAEIVFAWFWYIITLVMTVAVQVSYYPEFWKSINFWICIALNVVSAAFAVVYKEHYADKQKIRRYSKWPLVFSDAKHVRLVNYDITAVFLITIVDMILYIRPNAAVFSWMMNFIFVVAVILFALSYVDKKYGPKELTRAEKLAQRQARREERLAQAQNETPTESKPASKGQTPAAGNTQSQKKPKKKYRTGKRR